MKLMVRNFMGTVKADLDLSGIVLIAGKNYQGKTSVSMAYAALLTGQTLPYEDMLKSDAKEIVNEDATSDAICYFEQDGAKLRIDYPANVRKVEGEPIKASPYAAGLTSLLDCKDSKARAEKLAEILKIEVTKDDIKPHLVKMEMPVSEMTTILLDVDALTGEGACTAIKERGAKLKGRWESTTSSNFGSRVAKRWEPPMWTPDMAEMPEEFLLKQIEEARKDYENLLKIDAITEMEYANLQELVKSKAEKTDIVEAAKKAYADAEAACAAANKARDAYKVSTNVSTSQPCPHCKRPLAIGEGDRIIGSTAPGVSPDEYAAQLAKSTELANKAKEASSAREAARSDMDIKSKDLTEVLKAEQRLAAGKEVIAQAPDIEGAKHKLALAESRHKQWKQKMEADDLNAQITRAAAVYKLLSPEGIRATKLTEAIVAVNERLAHYAKIAGWKRPTITPDLLLKYGTKLLWKLSKSERFRFAVLLQIVIAELDGSKTVIVDGADLLDKDGRNGLVKVLHAAGLPALVTMTLSSGKEAIPDFAVNNIGRTYLINDGITALYTSTAEEKAA